jgi:chromosome segregation ATPase
MKTSGLTDRDENKAYFDVKIMKRPPKDEHIEALSESAGKKANAYTLISNYVLLELELLDHKLKFDDITKRVDTLKSQNEKCKSTMKKLEENLPIDGVIQEKVEKLKALQDQSKTLEDTLKKLRQQNKEYGKNNEKNSACCSLF